VVKKAVSKKKAAPKKVGKKADKTKKVAAPKASKKLIRPVIAKKKNKPVARAKLPKAAGVPEKIYAAVLKILDDKQADDLVKVDLRQRSALYDYMVIASGNPRQLQAIAAEMHKMLPSVGSKQVKIEGVAEGNWVLVDAGDVIVHLFRPEVREFYNLDQIYAETKSRK